MHRLGGANHFGETRVVDRHRAPAEKLQAFLFETARPYALAMGAKPLVAWHEDVTGSVLAGLRQFEAGCLGLGRQEVVRDLDQNAGAVAGQRIGTGRAAMLEVLEYLQCIFDDAMRFEPLEVGDEADAASILFKCGVEKTFSRRTARCAGFVFQQGQVTFAHL